jgi:hypothetical protein
MQHDAIYVAVLPAGNFARQIGRNFPVSLKAASRVDGVATPARRRQGPLEVIQSFTGDRGSMMLLPLTSRDAT